MCGIKRHGNPLAPQPGSNYTDQVQERIVDRVVIEQGTTPHVELYFSLKEGSRSGGEVDNTALIEGKAQSTVRHPQGRYVLHRLVDAVASRNFHAAIHDATRLCRLL